ncbi:uncharacterized protein LOC127725223 [Mytilus californianus]|uniref:uncharacterized protein LOC127725223 n=1 Tax=Mytilus californianus TaxID=6549 RepID=UPI00224722AA|nr:uncharacterized protein LOC127725223 [Mytilus californianus]
MENRMDQSYAIIIDNIEPSEPADQQVIDDCTSPTSTSVDRIHNFKEFFNLINNNKIQKFSKFKVNRRISSCCSYCHYFMLLDILERGETCIKVIVGHYTSSREIFTNNSGFGVGKFINELKEVKLDVPSDLFDFKSGLFHFKYEPSTSNESNIHERLCERLGERDYDFRHNNCEHLINYIISGEQYSDEAEEKSCCADFCTTTVGEFKEVGMKVALIIAFVSSLAGSLIRYSYVSLIVAGTMLNTSHEVPHGACSTPKLFKFFPIGKNVITHAKHVLDEHISILKLLDDPNGKRIIENIKSKFDEEYMCKIAYVLASDAILKTICFSLWVSVSVETMFFMIKLCFTLCPLRERLGWKSRIFWRKIIVRFVSGYSSIFVGIVFGFLGQAYLSPPAFYFFLLNLISSLSSRYIFSLLIGSLFDCFCKCYSKGCKSACKCSKSSCSSCIRVLPCCKNNPRNDYDRITDDNTNTKCTCKCTWRCFICDCVFSIVILVCLSGIIYPCVKYLD